MNPSKTKRIAFLNMIGENSWGIYTAGFKRSVEILLESVRSTYEVKLLATDDIWMNNLNLSQVDTTSKIYGKKQENMWKNILPKR